MAQNQTGLLEELVTSAAPTGIPEAEDIYGRFTARRKIFITFVLSFCAFLAPISTTSVLPAVQEISLELNTTIPVLDISNAVYLIVMGLSPCFWGPLGDTFGRRWVRITLAHTADANYFYQRTVLQVLSSIACSLLALH